MSPKETLIQSLIDEGYLKNPEIIAAFKNIDRADFVLPEYKSEAYGNYPLPIGEGQTISQPLTVAFMLELLDPQPGEKILDIGAGSGWQTALLAEIVGSNGQIIAVEHIPELCLFAQKNLDKYGLLIKNGRVKFYCRDATTEIPDGPYDKIIAAAASISKIPKVWRKILKTGGRIVAPVGGSIWLFTKKSETEWGEKEFPGFAFVPLIKNPKSEIPRPRLGSAEGGRNPKQIPNSNSQNFKRFEFKIPNLLKSRRFLIAILLLIITLAVLRNEIYFPHPSYPKSKKVEIEPGFGSRTIANLLKKEGVIRSKWIFVFYVSLRGAASGLKPGPYEFEREAMPAIVQKLIKGGTNEITITVPEGWDIKDIAEYLKKEKFASASDFENWTSLHTNFGVEANAKNLAKFSERFDFLKDRATGTSLEGYLFPDTYRIFKSATAEEIIVKMLENFGKKMAPDLRTEITRQEKTIFEIVTMASLIEKEVISDQDKATVSGIFWKRLKADIPLQVDATINYITGKKTTKISREETKIDSPYNTYKYRGLPKGPIANPGLSTIKAAIYPQKSPYLYYLSAIDGQTIFSKTLEEHNLAKVKYLTR